MYFRREASVNLTPLRVKKLTISSDVTPCGCSRSMRVSSSSENASVVTDSTPKLLLPTTSPSDGRAKEAQPHLTLVNVFFSRDWGQRFRILYFACFPSWNENARLDLCRDKQCHS